MQMAQPEESLTMSIVYTLWKNWVSAIVALIFVLIEPLVIPHSWQPFVVAAIAVVLYIVARSTSAGSYSCSPMSRCAVAGIFWSAVVMVMINILNSHMLLDGYIDWSNANREIPYISGLVLFPMVTLFTLGSLIRSAMSSWHSGMAEWGMRVNSLVANMIRNESRYQQRMLMVLTFTFSTIGWWYYGVYYVNVNLNTPDKFFFTYMPVAVLVLSTYFMWVRCSGLAAIIGPMIVGVHSSDSTERYIIIKGDRMLLSQTASGRWDTPAVLPADVEPDRLKYLYSSPGVNATDSVRHYVVFLSDDDIDDDVTEGSWFSYDEVSRLAHTSMLSVELADEMYRIYTITMAWKTYDRHGFRRYPVKNYRPSFTLSGLRDTAVDYNDLSWFEVANNNQDRKFFNLRRLWRNFTRKAAR